MALPLHLFKSKSSVGGVRIYLALLCYSYLHCCYCYCNIVVWWLPAGYILPHRSPGSHCYTLGLIFGLLRSELAELVWARNRDGEEIDGESVNYASVTKKANSDLPSFWASKERGKNVVWVGKGKTREKKWMGEWESLLLRLLTAVGRCPVFVKASWR